MSIKIQNEEEYANALHTLEEKMDEENPDMEPLSEAIEEYEMLMWDVPLWKRQTTLWGKVSYYWKENFWWKFVRFCGSPADLYREVKWFIQRGRRGYSDRDTWGMDDYLLSVVPPMIHSIRSHRMGHPIGLTDAKWEEILRLIEEGFIAKKEVHDCMCTSVKDWPAFAKEREEKFKVAMRYFGKYFSNLWD